MSEGAPPHALLRPRIALPFLTIALIWGSTWWVITTQIAAVPAPWSVTWRFALATPAMFALALSTHNRLAMPRAGHILALAVGLCQFSGNYNFVYQAELHLTSGIIAVMAFPVITGRRRYVLLLAPTMGLGITLLSGSRGVLLAAVPVVLALLATTFRRSWKPIAAGFVVLVIAGAVVLPFAPGQVKRFGTSQTPDARTRKRPR